MKKEIVFPFDLSARRAVVFSQEMQKLKDYAHIEKNSRRVNSKSLLGILSLGVKKNDKVLIFCKTAEGLQAMEEIIKHLKEEF